MKDYRSKARHSVQELLQSKVDRFLIVIATKKGNIYSTMVLVFVCLALWLVPGTHGLPIGVSTDACSNLIPDYINPTTNAPFPAQTGPSPYVLTVQPKTHTPGQLITVTVESWLDFEGILLQARVSTSTTPVGTWMPKEGYTLLTCSSASDFLTHSSNASKVPSVSFQWTAPSTTLGTVTFMATIAKNDETFWTPVEAVITNGAATVTGPCSSSPCVNGLCFTGGTSGNYLCSCNTGFTGTTCETKIVPTCPNGMECYEGECFQAQTDVTRYVCHCRNGYWGDTCYTRATACHPTNPCKNEGTCFLSSSNTQNHICLCATGYEQPNCEQQTVTPTSTAPAQPCDSNPCQNGGNCANNGNTYSCTCSAGYKGTNCDVMITTTSTPPARPCGSNPCQNGGNCVNNGNTYSCTCSAGYEGTNCDVMITPTPTTAAQPCDSNPCQNGNCANNGNTYSCTCSAGYEGTNCDVMTPPSEPCSTNPCKNGGACRVETTTTFTCVCLNGFGGDRCDTTVSCSTEPDYQCENLGTCVDGECQCRAGLSGNRCQDRACSLDSPAKPCDNGGTCSTQGVCTCPAGYMGTTCEDAINTTCIEGTTCMNGGTCIAAQNAICSCLPDYTGDTCELPVTNYCKQTVCQNGGTCINRSTRFSCACKDGYAGISCATFTGPSPTTNNALPLEIWWIALIALIGTLLFIILCAACYTILRSSHPEERHLVGNKRI